MSTRKWDGDASSVCIEVRSGVAGLLLNEFWNLGWAPGVPILHDELWLDRRIIWQRFFSLRFSKCKNALELVELRSRRQQTSAAVCSSVLDVDSGRSSRSTEKERQRRNLNGNGRDRQKHWPIADVAPNDTGRAALPPDVHLFLWNDCMLCVTDSFSKLFAGRVTPPNNAFCQIHA